MHEDNTYTIKEVMENNFAEMRIHLQEIKVQTTKTNGKVISLQASRVQIWTAIGVLFLTGGALITLSIMAIDAKIQKGVETAFNNKFDHIEVLNK